MTHDTLFLRILVKESKGDGSTFQEYMRQQERYLLIYTVTSSRDPLVIDDGTTTSVCTREPKEGCPANRYL